MSKPQRAVVERLERRDAVEYAQLSVAMEGLYVPDSLKAVQQRYIAGELNIDQVIEATRAYYGLSNPAKG